MKRASTCLAVAVILVGLLGTVARAQEDDQAAAIRAFLADTLPRTESVNGKTVIVARVPPVPIRSKSAEHMEKHFAPLRMAAKQQKDFMEAASANLQRQFEMMGNMNTWGSADMLNAVQAPLRGQLNSTQAPPWLETTD